MSEETKGNSMAFPDRHTTGLTKREYFAAMALQGFLSNSAITSELTKEEISEMAVRTSGIIIVELNKDKNG